MFIIPYHAMPTRTVVDEKLRYDTQGDAAHHTTVCCSLARKPAMGLGVNCHLPSGQKCLCCFVHTTAVDRGVQQTSTAQEFRNEDNVQNSARPKFCRVHHTIYLLFRRQISARNCEEIFYQRHCVCTESLISSTTYPPYTPPPPQQSE